MNTLEVRRRLLGRNVYKRTTEGNPAIAQGSLARRYPGITMQGWTEQDSTTGVNLFDLSKISSETVTVDGSDILLSGYANNLGSAELFFKPGTQYTIQAIRENEVTGSSGSISLRDFSGNARPSIGVLGIGKGYGTRTFTTPDDLTGYYLYAYGWNNKPEEDYRFAQPMFQKGSVATAYEPYTGGQPSPSPDYPQEIVSAGTYDEGTGKHQYEVKLTGANLFDISKVVSNSGLLTNNGDGTLTATPGSGDSAVSGKVPKTLRDYCPELISGKTYLLSANTTGTEKRIYLLGVNCIWGYGASRTITDAELDSEVCFYASGVNSEAVISDIMITEVEGADYEPYRTPQTVTLTSDRPLTKWDKLEKRNGQWGWAYKSNEVVLDGSEDEAWTVYNIGFKVANILPEVMLQRECYCTQFTRGTGFDENIVWLGSNAGNSDIYFPNVPSYYDAELEDKGLGNFKQHVSENPITILTYLDEETFVPLTAEEQEQMNALYTYRPTTVLSNQQDCDMALTYKTRKGMN